MFHIPPQLGGNGGETPPQISGRRPVPPQLVPPQISGQRPVPPQHQASVSEIVSDFLLKNGVFHCKTVSL